MLKKILPVLTLVFLTGCASTAAQKGIFKDGSKAYLGTAAIEDTQAFRDYRNSKKSEGDKQIYLFKRLRAADNLEFFRDGSWYKAADAYKGGMWLMKKYYKPGMDNRQFIRERIERSDAGNFHLVKYPDGSLQIGSYVLYNELDLLEEKAA